MVLGSCRGGGLTARYEASYADPGLWIYGCYRYTGAKDAQVLLDSSHELDVACVVGTDIAEVVVQRPTNVGQARVVGRWGAAPG